MLGLGLEIDPSILTACVNFAREAIDSESILPIPIFDAINCILMGARAFFTRAYEAPRFRIASESAIDV
jgi:hypothetical protein